MSKSEAQPEEKWVPFRQPPPAPKPKGQNWTKEGPPSYLDPATQNDEPSNSESKEYSVKEEVGSKKRKRTGGKKNKSKKRHSKSKKRHSKSKKKHSKSKKRHSKSKKRHSKSKKRHSKSKKNK